MMAQPLPSIVSELAQPKIRSMRQLTIQVDKGYGQKVLAIACEHGSGNASLVSARSDRGPVEIVHALIQNNQVGDLLSALETDLPSAEVSLLPTAVLSMSLPSDDIPKELKNTQSRSPLEVFLEGVQSIGSWPSYLTYAVVAGVIVWIGLYSNRVSLLVASMLIAPFGGPAMNAAIAAARGDFNLLKRSVVRYFAGLVMLIGVTFFLSLLFRQSIATAQMVSASELSATAILLPLAGGVAGALQLVQSERSSLVSGTAIGMLVAAALAPPAGLIGMALAIGKPEMAASGVFLLLLQLAAINLSCATVFRLYGVKPGGAVYSRGKRQVFPIALGLSGIAIALLLSVQFLITDSPDLLRSSRTQRAVAVIQDVVDGDQYVSLVESDVRFTRASIPDQNTLLSTVYVQPRKGQSISASSTSSRLAQEIQTRLRDEGFKVTPLVNVTVLEPLQ